MKKRARSLYRRVLLMVILFYILSISLIAVAIYDSTSKNFQHYTYSEDREMAKKIASRINKKLAEQKDSSVSSILESNEFEEIHSFFDENEIVAIDPRKGKIIYNSLGEEIDKKEQREIEKILFSPPHPEGKGKIETRPFRSLPLIRREEGIVLKRDGVVVAYLYVGNMNEDSFSPQTRTFLRSTMTEIFRITLIALFVFISFFYFYFYKIKKRSAPFFTAIKSIGKGKFSSRLEPTYYTELDSLGDSFNEMATSLDNTEKQRKELIANVSHELRTPVTLLKGELEMIKEGIYEMDEKRITSLLQESELLEDLIEDLTLATSFGEGNITLNRLETDFSSIFSEVDSILTPLAMQNTLTLNFSKNPITKQRFNFDKKRVKQLLINLIRNAIQHSHKEGEINIDLNFFEEKLLLTVEDCGVGVPEESLESIFERFYRVDYSRNRSMGGRGLGLAISKEIVEAHGGKIFAENREEGGLKVSTLFEV